ncbi:hypothetical protein [Halomonas maura]|uniref:hypothetical protein n=1 Tax=Halomonas maura TaxID=117606 RepID=UPI0025B4A817|nr:hypothetical protein [Halomonas maura]MDN3554620.1 hypothetical protein [Halomonas maura]
MAQDALKDQDIAAVDHEVTGEGMADDMGRLPLGEIDARPLVGRRESLAGLGK